MNIEKEIEKVGKALDLPKKIQTRAIRRLKEILESEDLMRGFSEKDRKEYTKKTLAVVIAGISREYKNPRRISEILKVMKVKNKKGIKKISERLRDFGIRLSPVSPDQFVPYFCDKLGLSDDTKSTAIEIIEKATEAGVTSDRQPATVAAAAIYIAAILGDEHRTQQEIYKATGVSDVTLRARTKELLELSKIENVKREP